MNEQNQSIQDARACITPEQRVLYVTEIEHTRCARIQYPRTQISCVTKLEQTRCARMHYPRTKDILCNRTRAIKMRAHSLRNSCVFIYFSSIFVNVVISHQEILYTCDRRGRFVYVCTCKCLESCSSPIGQTYYLTMQHDNG